jgi:hypothetical protein
MITTIALTIIVVFTILFEAFRKKESRADFYTFFMVSLYLMYIIPMLVWVVDPGYDQWFRYNVAMDEKVVSWAAVVVLLVVFVSALGFVFGSKLKISIRLPRSVLSPSRTSLFVSVYLAVYFGIFLIAIVLSGGFARFVQLGLESRGEGSYLGLSGYLRYFLVSAELFLPFLLVYAFYLNKINFNRLLVFIVFFLAVMLVAISTGSRAAIIYPFMLIFFFLFNASKHIRLFVPVIAILIFLAATLSVNYLRIVYYGNPQPEDGVMSSLGVLMDDIKFMFSYFKHYIITIYTSIFDGGGYEFPRLGLDVLRAIISAAPGVGKSDVDVLWLTSMPAQINKEYLGGLGYVPPGWIAYSLMSGSIPGLVLYVFLAFVVGGVLNRLIQDLFVYSKPIMSANMVLIFYVWYRVFFAQDPWQVVLANAGIYLIFLTWVVVFIQKKRLINVKYPL